MSKKDLNTLIESRLSELIGFVRSLDDQSREIIIDAISKKLTDPVLKLQVAQIRKLAKSTDAQVRQWLLQNVPKAYFDGFVEANQQTGKKVKITLEAFLEDEKTAFHRNAINLLLKDSYTDFARTMTGVANTAQQMLSDVARQQIRGRMIAGEMTGESVYKIAKDVRQTIAEDGFRVMIDRAGRKWQLPDYSEMLARTHLIKTANEGVVNRMAELGYDLVEWSTGDRPCDICDELNGKVFSISGESGEYSQLEEQPPRHPNCRCSLLPRPDLS